MLCANEVNQYMKINIKSTNLELTDSIYKYVEQKIGELDKFINVNSESLGGRHETVEAFVEVGRTTDHHNKGDIFRAEVQIRMPGDFTVRAESVQSDLYVAIDEVKDELQSRLKKYRGVQLTRRIRGHRLFKTIFRISSLARRRGEKKP